MATRRKKKEQPAAASPLEALLDYRFRDPKLLDLALTHRSFAYEARGAAPEKSLYPRHRNPPGADNEQLEFIGDAILGMIVSEALFREFPTCGEGELTRMRSVLVSRKRMAEFGAALGLETYVLLGKSALRNAAREKPALVANAAEALIAAIYLDSPEGKEAVCTLIQRLLIDTDFPLLRHALESDGFDRALRDFKTLLQDKAQAIKAKLTYPDIAMTGPPHDRTFQVEVRLEIEGESRKLAEAEGPSKKEAQQKAAELALALWDDLPPQDANA
ncbi:MAG: ribonuclease III [Bryocella sp.]